MRELSLQNIDHISRDISREEITFSHLLDDLIDHVCCDVENEMQQGRSFNEAYSIVKQKMGPRRIREIQKETLYAVDTKYRYMKKTMKISGIAGTVLLGFAAFFKIEHWPLAGQMMVLGAFLLAFVFMPSALGVLWKETHNRKRIFLFISAFLSAVLFITGIIFKVQHWPMAGAIITLAAISGAVLFVPSLLLTKLGEQENRAKWGVYSLGAAGLIFYITGLLCKLQHWPMATVLMMGGLAIIFLIVFPWYTVLTWKDEEHVSSNFIFMVVAALAIILPSALVSLNLQRTYETGFYIHNQRVQELIRSEQVMNHEYLKKTGNPQTSSVIAGINSKTESLIQLINDIEGKMVAETEKNAEKLTLLSNQPVTSGIGPEFQYHLLNEPFNARPVIDMLSPGSRSRQELESSLKDYCTYISGQIKDESLKCSEIMKDPSIFFPAPAVTEGRVSLISGLHALGLLKLNILALESNAFAAVSESKQDH